MVRKAPSTMKKSHEPIQEEPISLEEGKDEKDMGL